MARVRINAEADSQQIVFTCAFDGPRELVFRAFVDPELLPRWLGPHRLTMVVAESDPRPGGAWRFVHRAPDGSEFAFRGVYHDVVRPERIVRTFEFAGAAGDVSLEVAIFEEDAGQTTVRGQSVFLSAEARDAHLAAGMEEGLGESMERLAELLQQLRAA